MTLLSHSTPPRRRLPRATRALALALSSTWIGWATAADPSNDETAKAETFVQQMNSGKIACPLDRLVSIPDAWKLTPDRLETEFAPPKGVKVDQNPYYRWLTLTRTRAVFMSHPFSNLRVDLSLFAGALPVEEAVVDFLDGKLNGISFSLYNRADSTAIDAKEFLRRSQLCGSNIGSLLAVRPTAKKADPNLGLLAEGWTWHSPQGMATLESNPEAARGGTVEFLRLKIAPRDVGGTFAAAFQSRPTPAKLSELPKNVTHTATGDVFIKDMPMVDQGQKGYCVVAATQRLFEYYGIPADQYQLAQVVETDAKQGTDSLTMVKALGKIDFRFKTRFKILALNDNHQLVEVDERKLTVGKKVSPDQFAKAIHRHVDEGIPLLWALTLGRFPEDPPTAPQTAGGHMRLIIGYNDQTRQVLFSDSWGAGHELKRMTLDDSYRATEGLFVMSPTVH